MIILRHTFLMDRPTSCRSFVERPRVNHFRSSQKALESLFAFSAIVTADRNGRRERENSLPLPFLCHLLQSESHGLLKLGRWGPRLLLEMGEAKQLVSVQYLGTLIGTHWDSQAFKIFPPQLTENIYLQFLAT